MKQVLYSSFDWMPLADKIQENPSDWFYDADEHDESFIYQYAQQRNYEDYGYITEYFDDHTDDDLKIILIGQLGLWYGKVHVYKVSDPETCFEWNCDDLEIVYEDGHIWIYHYHHDGCNIFKVLGIKHPCEIDNEADREFREDLVDGNIELGSENNEQLDRITFSVAKYFKDYLNAEALADLGSMEVTCA